MSGQGKNAKREGARSNELYQLQALNRIVSAITGQSQPPAPAGLATEATLQAVQTAVESMRDYEVRLVTDSDAPQVTWLEVRYWDVQDGTLGAPQYYLPGSSTPGTPVGGISYIPTSTLLTDIKSELIAVNAELDAIKLDTAAIDTNTDGIEGLLTTIDAVLDTIKTDTTSIAGEDFATETTLALVKTVLDTIKTDSAAMVVDLAAIEALLITIDADTSNLDVLLSTRASEATLTAVDAVLDTIKLDTADIVTATENTETLLTGASKTPSLDTAVLDGSTTAGVKGLSMWVRGTGATIDGDAVPDGARFSWAASDNNDTVGSIGYTVPTGGAQEIIITYLT